MKVTFLPRDDMAHPANAPAAPVAELTRLACVKPPGIAKVVFPSPSTNAVSGYATVTVNTMNIQSRGLYRTMDAACVSSRFINSSIALKA